MAGRLMRLLFRPGWRLRCVDPPIAWVKIDTATVGVRIQLTCYLTSRYASSVRVKELRLRIGDAPDAHIAPWIRSVNEGDEPLGETLDYAVGPDTPHHAFIDFAVDSAELANEVQASGPPIPVTVEALLNDAVEFRKIADFELGRLDYSGSTLVWHRVTTGRELERPRD